MKFLLMRKDESITSLQIDETGAIVRFSDSIERLDIAPLAYRADKNWIKLWWNNRKIPKTRKGFIRQLQEKDAMDSGIYLYRNLGLSLTDYYWIKPVGSRLTWKEVNLYDNDFNEDLFFELNDSSTSKGQLRLSPNSSLQGDIEKTWKIINGERMLVKGNSDYSSEESLNELFASLIHKKQGYDNYVEYSPVKINGRNYSYGCICKAFTNQDRELITAWDIISSVRNKEKKSKYDIFVDECLGMGMERQQLFDDLDYMIITDFIISNRDRHMNNVGILRDAGSLNPIRLAPIFDSGKSMFVGMNVPIFSSDLLNNEINGFCNTEFEMLNLVHNRQIVDADKLPTGDELYKLYSLDVKMSEGRKTDLINAYKTKVEYIKSWQKN